MIHLTNALRTSALLALLAAPSAGATPMPATVQATLRNYCFDCHDDQTAKAKLSLESLAPAFNQSDSAKVWTRVHDKLARGEMPPKNKPQPSLAQRQEIMQWLRTDLNASSLDRQQRDGRVPLRRLNRTEYEQTLQDLFGVPVTLKELLPEDTAIGGFDKVSAGLQISAAHLMRYQPAADKAIRAALTPVPPRRTERITGKQRWEHWYPQDREEQRRSSDLHLRYSARLDGETLVFHQQTESNGFLEMEFGAPPHPGRYRLRAKVSARNSAGKPLPVLIFRLGIPREFNVNNARVIAVRDAPPDEPTVIEEEIVVTDDPHVGAGRRIALKGWSLAMQKHPDELRKDIAAGKEPDFGGPGLAVDWVEMEGPLDPSIGYPLLFGNLRRNEQGDPQSKDAKADAAKLLRAFLPVAFHRPVDNETAAPFIQFAMERLDRSYGFAEAMKAAYRNVLCSPRFLMLVEKPGPLDDHAIASRLSYFLWGSRPDDALLAGAAKGRLRKADGLRAEVERMLDDPKAQRFTDDFTGQWLDLRKLHMTKPDLRYVEFDDLLLWSMPRESQAFYDEILRHDRSVTEFVWSDWTFLNRRLAQHYGISGVDSWELRKRPLPASARRGGVMTHASILKVTANGTTTSPVLRGKWVLEKIIGRPPSPPPPDLPALEPDIRGATTIRQQLDQHRHLPACATCHVKIDPPGFALETYDVIGGWRDWYRGAADGSGGKERVVLANYPEKQVWRGPDVEKGFTMGDGRAFADVDGYRKILLEDPEQLARNLVEKLIAYATGEEIQFADREVVEQIVRETKRSNHGLRSIIHAVVQSRCFLNK